MEGFDELKSKIRGQDQSNGIKKDAKLQIASRTIASEDYVMQISNISQASIGSMPRKKISLPLVLICGAISLGLFRVSSWLRGSGGMFIFFALIPLAIIGYHLYTIYQQTQQYGLTIELNSGKSLFFLSEEKKFLREVLDLIDDRMQSPGISQEILVAQFGEGSIYNYHSGSGDIISGGNVRK